MDFNATVASMLDHLQNNDDEATHHAFVEAMVGGISALLAAACDKKHFVENTNCITAEIRQRAAMLFIEANAIPLQTVILAAQPPAGGMH